MKQDVNLLQPMFRKQRALFSARISVAICVLVVGVLTLLYGVAAWRTALLDSEQARLEAQRDSLNQRLTSVATQFQGHGKSQKLEAQLVSLKQERDRKRQTLDALSRRELGNTRGFSSYFVGLARQRLNGLWLTRVELSASGQQMELQGVTLSEALIPRYLRALGGEEVFEGTQFGQAVLQRENENSDKLKFELKTSAVAGALAGMGR